MKGKIKHVISQLIVAGVVFFAVTAWRESDLLKSDGTQPAPYFSLPVLEAPDNRISLAELKGKPSLIYFFAPWCSICKLSMPNLEALAEAEDIQVIAIALDYTSAQELLDFKKELNIDIPILMGDRNTASNYRISAFPTYYIVGADLQIRSRSMGYSTELGLKLRATAL